SSDVCSSDLPRRWICSATRSVCARSGRPLPRVEKMQASAGHTSLTALKGIGPALEEKLNRLGLRSVEDILFHLPLRYQDRTRITPIGALRHRLDAVIEGVVVAAD